jgi:hypothetical protein
VRRESPACIARVVPSDRAPRGADRQICGAQEISHTFGTLLLEVRHGSDLEIGSEGSGELRRRDIEMCREELEGPGVFELIVEE